MRDNVGLRETTPHSSIEVPICMVAKRGGAARLIDFVQKQRDPLHENHAFLRRADRLGAPQGVQILRQDTMSLRPIGAFSEHGH